MNYLFLFICHREIIFGYQDLKVQLFYSAGCLETYLGMTYTEKVNAEYEGVEADEVLTKIAAKLAPDVHYSLTNFTNALSKDDTFTPHGKLIHSFSLNGTLYMILLYFIYNYLYIIIIVIACDPSFSFNCMNYR